METSYFGELTGRMREFREELLNSKPQVCAERAIITTETYRANMDQPLALRRAFDSYNHDERPVYFKTAECGTDCGTLGAAELVKSQCLLNS
jgi:hypothetical protein